MDYDDAVAITRDIHWVGFNDPESGFHCNPYLLVDDDEAVLFDPGSIPHFPVVMRNVLEVVSPQQIRYLVAHHQDPDVCGNLAVVEDVIGTAELTIVSSRKCMPLVRHYGLHSTLYETESHEHTLTLLSGRELRFVPTPFLHSPGAFATYDTRTKSLFSSDLFGAIADEWRLFAGDDPWSGMRLFHQAYMPSHMVLGPCIERLEQLDIERILPQHGSVLEGPQVAEAMAFLKELRCGVDLMDEPQS